MLVAYGPIPFYFLTLKVPRAVVKPVEGAQTGHRGVFRSVFLTLATSHDPSGEAKRPAIFLREWIEIACAYPAA